MASLPDDIAALVTPLRDVTFAPDELQQLVTAHLEAARTAAATSAVIDLNQAEAVATACLGLLDRWPDVDEVGRGWIHAACLYFASVDDDFSSRRGFDDDAAVVRHVVRLLD